MFSWSWTCCAAGTSPPARKPAGKSHNGTTNTTASECIPPTECSAPPITNAHAQRTGSPPTVATAGQQVPGFAATATPSIPAVQLGAEAMAQPATARRSARHQDQIQTIRFLRFRGSPDRRRWRRHQFIVAGSSVTSWWPSRSGKRKAAIGRSARSRRRGSRMWQPRRVPTFRSVQNWPSAMILCAQSTGKDNFI